MKHEDVCDHLTRSLALLGASDARRAHAPARARGSCAGMSSRITRLHARDSIVSDACAPRIPSVMVQLFSAARSC